MTPLEDVQEILRGASRPAQFRTVVSRAYYVSFRRLVGVCTPLGFQQDLPIATSAARPTSVHARLRDYLQRSARPVLVRVGRDRLPHLFRLRIVADYRLTAPVTRDTAQEATSIATDIDDWLNDAALPELYR